jgi:SAM-dependent methyltransferase
MSVKLSISAVIQHLLQFFRRTKTGQVFEPEWYKEAVGGLWEEIGKLQFDYLVTHGLEPHHYFLDVGCGSMRGGRHFVRYLEPKHYYGIDADENLLEAGKDVLRIENLLDKHPVLARMHDFDFASLGQKFDYALAQSVFTHLPLNNIIRCIMNIDRALVQEGLFFATFFENPQGKFNLHPIWHPRADGEPRPAFFDSDGYHYDFATFEWICQGTSLRVSYIGDWHHPRDQRLMVFRKI